MAITVVQAAPVVQSASLTTATVTLANPTGSGNSLVVCVTTTAVTTLPAVSGITLGGSAGSFAAVEINTGGGNPLRGELWYNPGCAAGQTSVVVTCTGGAGGSPAIYVAVYEISGLLIVDKHTSTAVAGSTTWTSGATATTAQANEIFIAAASGTASLPTVTGVGTWNSLSNSTGTYDQISGSQIVSAAGTATYSGTMTSGGATAVIATFWQAPTGGPSVLPLAPGWHPGWGLPGVPGGTPFWAPPLGGGSGAVTPVTVFATAALAGAGGVTAVGSAAGGTAIGTANLAAAGVVGVPAPVQFTSAPGLAVPGLFTPGSPGIPAGVPAIQAVTAAVAGAGAITAASLTPAPGKVVRSGTSLMKDGQPWRLIGLNIWPAAVATYNYPANTPPILADSGAAVLNTWLGDILATAPHVNTIRFWALQQFALNGTTRDWTAIDAVLTVCAANGFKVVATLEDNWSYERTGAQTPALDATWFSTGYSSSVLTAETITYRAWVSEIVTRYAGDPRIAVWELLNEGNSETVTWLTDVAGLVKSIDPFTPVGDGKGDTSAPLAAVTSLDMPSYHYYTDFGQTAWAAVQSAAATAGKPWYMGEMGNSSSGTTRSSAVNTLMNACFADANTAGFLYWEYFETGGDSFVIRSGDAVLPVLDGYAPGGAPGAALSGSGAVTANATVIPAATVAAAGAVTATATVITAATLTGAGNVAAKVTQTAPATATGAGGVADVATQIASATVASAGAVATKVTQTAPAAVAAAGAVGPDPVTQIATATLAAAGVVNATPLAAGAGTAAIAGAGVVTAAVTQAVTAAPAGAGSIAAAAGQAVTATVVGAGVVTAGPTQAAPASVAGAGAVTALAGERVTAALTGAGAVNASGHIAGTANLAAAGSITAKTVQAAGSTPAAAGALSAAAGLAAPAVLPAAGAVTATGSVSVAFTVGALSASVTPTATQAPADRATNALTASTAASSAIT